jgi:hypothetical protein
MITAHFVGSVPAITATHVNGKRGFLAGGSGKGLESCAKTQTQWGCLAPSSSWPIV